MVFASIGLGLLFAAAAYSIYVGAKRVSRENTIPDFITKVELVATKNVAQKMGIDVKLEEAKQKVIESKNFGDKLRDKVVKEYFKEEGKK